MSLHGDEAATVWHAVVYELSNTVGVLMIPLVAFLLQPPARRAAHRPVAARVAHSAPSSYWRSSSETSRSRSFIS